MNDTFTTVDARVVHFYTRAAEREAERAVDAIADLRFRLKSMLESLDRVEGCVAAEPSARQRAYQLRMAASSLSGDAGVIASAASEMERRAAGAEAVLDAVNGIAGSAKKEALP